MPMPEFMQLVQEIKKHIREISPQQLRDMLSSDEKPLLIDVREPDEWQKGTIPGAATIARGWLEMRIDQLTTDKDANIVLYCAGGNRSAFAAENLQRMGFRRVSSLTGGYNAWQSETQK